MSSAWAVTSTPGGELLFLGNSSLLMLATFQLRFAQWWQTLLRALTNLTGDA
jgi:hypothetical protein